MFDHIVVVGYLAITLVIGIIAGRKTDTFSDFAVGKRNFSTLVLLAAIMASLIEASETIDFTRQILTDGMIYCIAYLGTALASLFLAYFFAPKFGRFLGRAVSTGDLIQEIYGKRAKTLIGIFTLFEMVLLAGAQVLAISLIANYFLGFPKDLSAIVITIVTLIYFLRGGARSVNATDVFQFGIMILGLPIICGIALSKIGGISAIFSLIELRGLNFSTSNPASCSMSMANFIIFAMPGLYPLLIQRMLMAKDTRQLKNALVMNAIVGTPIRIAIIALGIASFILIPNVYPDVALLEVANFLIPVGFRGLAIVGLLAILMSTIDSAIHLGAVAFTQDLLGSFINGPFEDRKKLKMARFASIFITLGTLFIALNFSNIEYIFYLLMAFGNTVMWPGLFLGLTGITNSKKGFWLGVIASLIAVSISIFIFDVFLLYANLIGIGVNTFTHITYAYFVEKKVSTAVTNSEIKSRVKINILHSLGFINETRFIKNHDYCNIFSICSVLLAIYPFFIFKDVDAINIILIFNILIGIAAVLLLFRELWNQNFARIYPFLWGVMVALALPTQTYFMIFTATSPIWLIDAVLIIPLVTILTSRNAAFLLHVIGILISISAALLIDSSNLTMSADFGYWAILVHILVLALCLALFRKRDVEICRFTTATLVHETHRALSTFESSAHFYEKRMPEIVSQYRKFAIYGDGVLSPSELKTMVELPNEIKKLSQRTRSFLKNFYDQISSYSGKRTFVDVNLRECILAAISDSSLGPDLQQHIHFEKNVELMVKGDSDQIIQVLINILENAGHALISIKNPHIDIKIEGHTILITDNGIGINSADLPNIFDELFSTKSTSGQGLAFCKRVMLEHGGNILCTSEKNNFTRFELRFPAKYDWSSK